MKAFLCDTLYYYIADSDSTSTIHTECIFVYILQNGQRTYQCRVVQDIQKRMMRFKS
jgi:hypothetical protein